jgi:hypothetical protein
MDLFDFAETQARTNDPETSHLGAMSIESKLSGLRRKFAETCRRIGGGTAQEIAAEACDCPREAESVRKRAKECVDLGFVRISGSARRCRVTNSLAMVYEAINDRGNESATSLEANLQRKR